jgi:hypothetical protein
LVDLLPNVVNPTWRNDRTGVDSISKRLDSFLVSEFFLSTIGRYHSWVELPFFSDRASILAQFDLQPSRVSYPLKLNPAWLLEEYFSVMVKKVWADPSFLEDSDIQHHFVWKLKVLKKQIKVWARRRSREKFLRLESLEEDLRVASYLLQTDGLDHFAECQLKSLEYERNTLLLQYEELWRQRSRMIWLKYGDLNTKFFHNFSSENRNMKHIWENIDDFGQSQRGQAALKKEASRHFKVLFKADDLSSPVDQLNLVSLFSNFVTEEDYIIIDHPYTLLEISDTLKLFAKDKIPGPDGWTVEFFLHFVDILGNYMLELVEDYRIRGKVKSSLNSTFLALI